MNRPWMLLLVAECLLIGCSSAKTPAPSTREPKRVVSLAPAITETIYALGAEDKLVGVTRFCQYPPDAQKKTTVGGRLDPNWEALYQLHPDVVLLPQASDTLRDRLEQLGLNTVELPQKTVEDVFTSIRILGNLLQKPTEANALAQSLRQRLDSLRHSVDNQIKPRVLLVVSREYHAKRPEEVYIAGKDGLCNALLEIAGATNAYSGNSPFPKVSLEGIAAMKPEVLVELLPPGQTAQNVWNESLPPEIIKKMRLVFLSNEPPLLPSPSMVDWTEELSRKIRDSSKSVSR